MNTPSQQQYGAPQQPANGVQTSSRGRIIKPAKPFTSSSYSTPSSRSAGQPNQQQRLAAGMQSGVMASSSLNPNAVPRMPGKHQLSNEPGLPLIPLQKIINNRYQALYTTYPARMRLGTSMLIQPSALAGSSNTANSALAGGGASGSGTPGPSGTVTGKRTRQTINYAEIERLDSSDEDSYDSSDARRAGGAAARKEPKQWGDGKSYLGATPPTNLVTVQPVKLTKYPPMYEEVLEHQALDEAILVPIQIELDVDTFKLRDSFMWNINERMFDPKKFAEIFCADLELPQQYAVEVEKQIQEQIEEQTATAEIHVRSHEEADQYIEKDLRVIVNLDVQIGMIHLQDRLEWDLSSSLTPELFAATVVQDLCLPTSAGPIISYALHEELLKHKKTIIEHGLLAELTEGSHLHPTRRRAGPRKLEGIWREWQDAQTFAPRVEILTLDEMDKVEAERERASRRAKRDRLAGRSARRR